MPESNIQSHGQPVSDRSQSFLAGVTVSEEVWALRPDYNLAILVAEGLSPGPSDSASENLLKAAEERALAALDGKPTEKQPHIAQWREAYNAFGAKPKKYKPSVEALVQRIEKGGLPRIDRLTDGYNAISIAHMLPLGGEDVDRYQGSAKLVRTDGEMPFDTTVSGGTVQEKPPKGEVVWADDLGVTCRRWNWRQCVRTRITGESKNVVFILDGLGALGREGLQKATDELIRDLQELHPGVAIASRLLSKDA